jgi:subtilisin
MRSRIIVCLMLVVSVPALAARRTPLRGTSIDVLRSVAQHDKTLQAIVGVRVERGASVTTARHSFAARHPGVHVVEERAFHVLPYFCAEIPPALLDEVLEDDDVTSVERHESFVPMLVDTTVQVGATTAWSQGYSGAGQMIVLLDTGVDKSTAFLSGKVKYEACFSTSRPPAISSLCPNGQASQIGPGTALNCDASIAGCFHGTFIAGVAAGRNGPGGMSGVARDADLMSIQVFTRRDPCGPSPCVSGDHEDLARALEHVYTIRGQYPIAAVNMSIALPFLSSSRQACGDAYPVIADHVALLKSAGIAVVGAAGNDGRVGSVNAPGCVPGVVDVGATTKDDLVWSGSNSATILDLLAPGSGWSTIEGSGVVSSMPGGTFEQHSGTSIAAPHVAGAFAVLRGKSPHATVDKLLSDLHSTGRPVTDPRNGLTLPRIDIGAALALGDSTPPSVPTQVTASGTSASSIHVAWNRSTDDFAVAYYVLQRRTSAGEGWTDIGVHADDLYFDDTGRTGGTAYQYRVAAVDTASNPSAWSEGEIGVAMLFFDDPVNTSTAVRGIHVGQLRQAVDAWRAFAQKPRQWTSYAALTGFVVAGDWAALVASINEARAALGLSAFSYSAVPTPASGVAISREHVNQLRNALR